jgi:hypothetical protein
MQPKYENSLEIPFPEKLMTIYPVWSPFDDEMIAHMVTSQKKEKIGEKIDKHILWN